MRLRLELFGRTYSIFAPDSQSAQRARLPRESLRRVAFFARVRSREPGAFRDGARQLHRIVQRRDINSESVSDWLRDSILFGRLAVTVVARPPRVFEPFRPPIGDFLERYEETKNIEIILQDDDGVPIPRARYEVTFADGSTRSGILDKLGRKTLMGVPAGRFRVVYPDQADIRAKVLAQRLRRIVQSGQPDWLRVFRILENSRQELESMIHVYNTLFGGRRRTLRDDLLDAALADEFVDELDDELVFLNIDELAPSDALHPNTNGDRDEQ